LHSNTVITLLLRALDRVPTQAEVFDRDAYESGRTALPGARLLKLLVVFQLIKSPKLRGLVRALEDQPTLQAAAGGAVTRNTLSNALRHRDLEQMIEAWLLVLAHYQPWLARQGRQFARLAVVDASLIKLSLAAFDWAAYRKKKGAAKMTVVLDWVRGVPRQFVFTVGKVHDLKAAATLHWSPGWTYVFAQLGVNPYYWAGTASVSAANYRGQSLARESIAAAFGTSLATGIQVAASLPLPTTLAGTTVRVRGSTGAERPTPPFFVSPSQVNYQIPPGTETGPATMIVTGGNSNISIGTTSIVPVAPGVFTADATGSGLATAYIVRAGPNNSQEIVFVSRYNDEQKKFVAVPVEFKRQRQGCFSGVASKALRVTEILRPRYFL